MSVTRRILSAGLFPFLLSLLTAIACYAYSGGWSSNPDAVAGSSQQAASSGISLGLFLGGLLLVTLLVPPLIAAETSSANQLISLAGILLPLVLFFTLGAFHSLTFIGEWFMSVAILCAYGTALAGVTVGFRPLRCPSAVSAALTVVMGLAWMTWPIWLSRTWHGEASAAGVARLVTFHPGMAMNGVLIHQFSPWSEQSIAYHLTDLSQNVPYALPSSAWFSIMLHSLLGSAIFGWSAYRERRENGNGSTGFDVNPT